MIKLFKRKVSIKTRIFTSVLGLIVSIIIGIALSFNLLVDKYIENSSNEKLKEAQEIICSNDEILSKLKPEHGFQDEKSYLFNKYSRNFEERIKKVEYQAETKVMIIDNNSNILFPINNTNVESDDYKEKTDEDDEGEVYKDILSEIKNSNINLNSEKNDRITTRYNEYYISHKKIINVDSKEEYYLILFIDISNILAFSNQINTVLLVIMCIAGILSIGIAIILSNKVAKPIQRLCFFAKDLGEGRFNKCEIEFCDKEIDELAKIMNKSAEDLEKYDKEQKIFFQNVSHELRTPLMSIKGYAEAIKYNVLDKNSASDVILEESERLVELIEELLYVSKMDNITKDYVLVEHDMREILSNCTLKQKVRAISLGIEFEYDFDNKPVLFMCDEKSIYRAFLNIIENALRYAKSKIIIRCKNINGEIVICIENDGDEIKEEDMPYIFDRFYKGDRGKHGIGLSIVKSIIDKHKGKVLVENTKFGVKFVITLKSNKK